jgi:hypothetical protein
MVNSLLCVKPTVPMYHDLKVWSTKQQSIRSKIGMIRYGTPKPVQGIAIRVNLKRSNSRSSSNGDHLLVPAKLKAQIYRVTTPG